MTKTALVVIDVQNDYFPGGKKPLHEPEQALHQIRLLLAQFRQQQQPIIHIQHVMLNRPNRPATFFIAGTEGVEIHPGVEPQANEVVLQKHFPSSFAGTGLHDLLQQDGIQQLVICGMMTQMCVDTTTRAAFDLGYQVQVALDATACPALSFGDTEIPAETVKATVAAALHGTFGLVTDTETILSA